MKKKNNLKEGDYFVIHRQKNSVVYHKDQNKSII
jgi:hypothetical protein